MYTANRLQRWACTLLLYDFEISYVSTNSFGYADFLSRLINSRAQPDKESVIATIHMKTAVKQIQQESIYAVTVTSEDIQQETKNDPTLQSVINYLNLGSPSDKKDITDEIQPYYIRRNNLLVVNNSLMLGERVVIPPKLRNKVLRHIHKGHPGMEKAKSIARSYVYWPKINSDIEESVRTCSKCTAAKKSPTKTLLQSWQMPDTPWKRIHVDFAGPFYNNYFLVIVDAKSKWPEIYMTKSITSSQTLKFIKDACSRYTENHCNRRRHTIYNPYIPRFL